jgi:hypothetical protein
MTKRKVLFTIVLLLLFILPSSALAQGPPDVIHEYLVTIEPQLNGDLNMRYDFDYCASTDFPANSAYLDISMANRNFKILDYGPRDWVTDADENGGVAHLEFASLPKAGDCFKFWFTVNQQEMANPKGEEVSFQFWPGMFTFAETKHLVVAWKMPADPTSILFKNTEPVETNGYMVWETSNLAPEKSLTIELLYTKAAFPELKQAATASNNSSNNGDSQPANSSGGGIKFSLLSCLCMIMVFLVICYFIYTWNRSSSDNDDSDYGTGSWIGTSPTATTNAPRRPRPTYSAPSCVSTPSRPKRRTGGGGSRSGRTTSCACVSSCACACAGSSSSGRAGCTQKGFIIGFKEYAKRLKNKKDEA